MIRRSHCSFAMQNPDQLIIVKFYDRLTQLCKKLRGTEMTYLLLNQGFTKQPSLDTRPAQPSMAGRSPAKSCAF